MLTLHNDLNDHLFRIGRHPNSLCPRCGEGRETPTHVFEQCVALTALKFSIFGSIATTLAEVVRDRKMVELSRFVSLAALSCWGAPVICHGPFIAWQRLYSAHLSRARNFPLPGITLSASSFQGWRLIFLSWGHGQWVNRPEPWLLALPFFKKK